MKVLVVDDNAADRFACRRALERRSCVVVDAAGPDAAFAALDTEGFDSVLSDFNLKSAQDGIDVLVHALRTRPDARRVLMSGFYTPGTVERAEEQARIHAAIEKPDTPALWAEVLTRALLDPAPPPSERPT